MRKFCLLLITIISICAAIISVNFSRIQKKENERVFLPISPIGLDLAIKTIKQLEMEKTVIQNIRAAQKLNILDVDLTQSVTVQNKLFDMDAFGQSKKLTFYGTGSYCVNLEQLTPDDIQFLHDDKIIKVYVQKPETDNIYIDENKSTAESTQNGILRFGELKLTPEEYNEIMKTVTESMRGEMKTDKMTKRADAAAKKSVRDLFEKVLSAILPEYTVIVEIKPFPN